MHRYAQKRGHALQCTVTMFHSLRYLLCLVVDIKSVIIYLILLKPTSSVILYQSSTNILRRYMFFEKTKSNLQDSINNSEMLNKVSFRQDIIYESTAVRVSNRYLSIVT